MLRIPLQKISTLSAALPTSLDFLIVGEMHGAKQNASIMRKLLRLILAKSRPCTIAFEWNVPAAEQEALREYIHGGNIPTKLPAFFLDSDGRFTVEHISLLKWIRSYNKTRHNCIDICLFDRVRMGQDPDTSMAAFLQRYKKQHPNSTVLVETGVWHARRPSDKRRRAAHPTMASILAKKNSIFSILLFYKKGKITVEGKCLDVTHAASQRENPKSLYDAVIDIPLCVPALPPKDLTKLRRLLMSNRP